MMGGGSDLDSKYIDRNGGWVKPEGMIQWAKENKVQARERVCINDIDYELFVRPDGGQQSRNIIIGVVICRSRKRKRGRLHLSI